MVTDGAFLYDALDPTVPDLSFSAQWNGLTPRAYGLAFSNDAQRYVTNQNAVPIPVTGFVDGAANAGNSVNITLQTIPQLVGQTATIFADGCDDRIRATSSPV